MTRSTPLEEAITRAGRRRVFAVVTAAGWTRTDSIPEFVWREAVRMIEKAKEPAS